MRAHLKTIAQSTAVWNGEGPAHLIHFDGGQLRGPSLWVAYPLQRRLTRYRRLLG